MRLTQQTRFRVLLGVGAVVLFFVTLFAAVTTWVRLDPVASVRPATQRWIMARLRATLERTGGPKNPNKAVAKELKRRFPGPVFVVLYLRGRVIFRYRSPDKIALGQAIERAREALLIDDRIAGLSKAQRRATRFKVDLTTARGPIMTRPRILLALSVVPGIDGLGLSAPGGKRVYLTPDELLRRNLVTGFRPFKFVKEFKAGLHIDSVSEILARRAGLDAVEKGKLPAGELFRFRTQGFVEARWEKKRVEQGKAFGRGDPLPVFRGNTPPPPFNKKTVARSLIDGGNYMLRMLARAPEKIKSKVVVAPSGQKRYQTEMKLLPGERQTTIERSLVRGQFRYIYYPLVDNYRVTGYSLPRHAGTTYALALLAGMLEGSPYVDAQQIQSFRRGAVLAIEYLADRVGRGKCKGPDFTCVSLGPVTDLGSTALPVVAVMEYTRQTGDRRFLPLGRKMANFLVYMLEPDPQKPAGEFCHIYDVRRKQRRCKTRLLYYSGEAALALGMAYNVTKDPVYLKAAEKALDYQTIDYLAPLTMKFLYGEDHWTTMACDEIWPHLKKDAYASFAYGFAKFQQAQQFVSGETPFDDYVGGYGITPFFPPHLTPAGSRTEAAISAYRLSQKRKEPRTSIKNQCLRAYRYIVTHQVRPANSYMFVNPAVARGAIRKSPVKFDVRIDYVQHTMAAMVRGFDLVPE
jgi:hypothetical protein